MGDIIHSYLTPLIKNEDFIEYEVKTPGTTGKGDGYLGKVTFVTITGKTKKEDRKILNLVLKTTTWSDILREKLPVKELFQKEIYIYDEVVPIFKNFQKDMEVKNDLLDFLPECYLTDKSEGHEFLILQNMKPLGFDVCDRSKPMPYHHIKLVLEALGRWHAFSFALKHKQPATFQKLVKANNINMWTYHIFKMGVTDIVFNWVNDVKNISKSDEEITNKLNFTKNDTKYAFTDLFFEDPDYHVILHGDCWTNNLMFKFDNDAKTPTDVRFIDWQLSAISSPVMDLSYFIYNCVDTGIYDSVDDLLNIYHKSLSDGLLQLGCDSSQIFPYETLIKHWQRFSRFGMLLATFILKFSLANVDEVPDFTEIVESGKDFMSSFEITIANEDLYHKRIQNNYRHYIRNAQSFH